MKKAFIGKGFSHGYVCFTRYKMENGVASVVHSEANKYDVTHYVECCILNWIGERIKKSKEEEKDFGEVVGEDFNKLSDKFKKEETEIN